MRRQFALLCGFFAASLLACETTEFPSELEVEKDRPFAGRVSVEGDLMRATPAPGERAMFELLVGSPHVQVPWTYVLTVCRVGRSDSGMIACDVSTPAIAATPRDPISATPPDGLPSIGFTVPDAATLGPDEDLLLVQGSVCPNGPLEPALLAAWQRGEPNAVLAAPNPCADKTQNGLIIAAPFRIERAPSQRNQTPLIVSTSWSMTKMKDPIVAGSAWSSRAPADRGESGCRGGGLLELPTSKTEVAFQIELAATAREDYLEPARIEGQPDRARTEIPQIEGLATAGEFGIARDNQQTAGQILQLTWKPPQAPIDPSGQLVRFWFLVSDNREGSAQATSWVERALCVLPAGS